MSQTRVGDYRETVTAIPLRLSAGNRSSAAGGLVHRVALLAVARSAIANGESRVRSNHPGDDSRVSSDSVSAVRVASGQPRTAKRLGEGSAEKA